MKVWRVGEIYQHSKETTVLDVVLYETQELGNVLHIDQSALTVFGGFPANRSTWICKTREAAREYGTPKKLYFDYVIVATDDYKGYLVIIL